MYESWASYQLPLWFIASPKWFHQTLDHEIALKDPSWLHSSVSLFLEALHWQTPTVKSTVVEKTRIQRKPGALGLKWHQVWIGFIIRMETSWRTNSTLDKLKSCVMLNVGREATQQGWSLVFLTRWTETQRRPGRNGSIMLGLGAPSASVSRGDENRQVIQKVSEPPPPPAAHLDPGVHLLVFVLGLLVRPGIPLQRLHGGGERRESQPNKGSRSCRRPPGSSHRRPSASAGHRAMPSAGCPSVLRREERDLQEGLHRLDHPAFDPPERSRGVVSSCSALRSHWARCWSDRSSASDRERPLCARLRRLRRPNRAKNRKGD